MSFQSYLKQELRRRWNIKLSSRNCNILLGCMVFSMVLFYVYIWPMFVGLWKTFRVAALIVPVDVGEDTFVPRIKTLRIPPLVHHITPTESSLPIEWQHSYDSCKGVHQRFEGADKYTFKVWRDEDMRALISEEFPWFLSLYDSYPQHIQKVDAARFFILRKFGGAVIDIDVGCRRSLDNLRRLPQAGMILAATSPFGLSSDFMMSAPEHPFALFVTERLKEAAVVRFSPFATVMFSTGSAFLSIAAYDFLRLAPQAGQDLDADADSDSDVGLLTHDDYTAKVLFHANSTWTWMTADGRMAVHVLSYIFVYAFAVCACLVCCHASRSGGLDRLALRANMKNVHTARELVEVLSDTGMGKLKEFATTATMNSRFVAAAVSRGKSGGEGEQQASNEGGGTKARLSQSRKPSTWRHGVRDRENDGSYLSQSFADSDASVRRQEETGSYKQKSSYSDTDTDSDDEDARSDGSGGGRGGGAGIKYEV